MVRWSSRSSTANAGQSGGALRAARHQGDPDACFEQGEKVALGAHLVKARNVEILRAQHIEQRLRRLAIGADHQPLLPQIVDGNARASGQDMRVMHQELKVLGEERPAIEPLPLVADLGGETELDVAALEIIEHLGAVAAHDLQLEAFEQFAELDHVRRDQRRIDGVRHREPERADFALLDGGSKRAGADGAVVALLQQRQHALAELGELSLRALAPEQIAAELALELADGAGERRLGDVAFLRGAREIEHPRHGEEIADLMHFHEDAPRPL